MTHKKWTSEEIEQALIEAGYSWQPIRFSPNLPVKILIETNKLNRQFYCWVQMDSEGNVTWFGNKFQAAKRANLFSFKLRF
ncbi:hypothetical protein [Microcoleus sp. AT3-D2]|uniref:hypothetical protein n=1 Tax=Microcoleus sp. AT3-D2 TaxID=2818612 RepID=UPI002FD0D702